MTEYKLTPKQERFCQAYIETGNASEAYRQAYDAENMKAETVHVKASELHVNGKIAVRLEQLQAEHRERHDVTVDTLTEELEAARTLAVKNKQAGAAVQAVMGKAKLHGLLVDKSEHGAPGQFAHLSDEQLIARIKKLDKKVRPLIDAGRLPGPSSGAGVETRQ